MEAKYIIIVVYIYTQLYMNYKLNFMGNNGWNCIKFGSERNLVDTCDLSEFDLGVPIVSVPITTD